MATATTTSAPSAVPDLNDVYRGELAKAFRSSADAHERFLQKLDRSDERYNQLLDRVMLDSYVTEQMPAAQRAMDLNVASHVPYPQPWASPVRAAGT